MGHVASKMGQSKSSKRKQWRKDKITELAGDGLSNRAISDKLQIPHTSVDRIVNELKQEEKAKSSEANDEMPFIYRTTIAAISGMIRYLADIMYDKKEDGTYLYDVKERMQAVSQKLNANIVLTDMEVSKRLSYESIELATRYRGLMGQNKEVVIDVNEYQQQTAET